MARDLFAETDASYETENQSQHCVGPAGSSGFGIAGQPHVAGIRQCVSGNGCKLGDGRKKETEAGDCGLCGGRIAKR